jgi:hypothetical protein
MTNTDLFPTVALTDAVDLEAGMIDITPDVEEEALDQADEREVGASPAQLPPTDQSSELET